MNVSLKVLSWLTFLPVKFEENFSRAVIFVSDPTEDPPVPVSHLTARRGRDGDAGHVSLTLNTVQHVLNMSQVCVSQSPCPPHALD